jgi:hypothetical protein
MSGSRRTHRLTGSEPAGQQETVAELKSTVAQQQKDFDSKLAKQQKQIEAQLTAFLELESAISRATTLSDRWKLDNFLFEIGLRFAFRDE